MIWEDAPLLSTTEPWKHTTGPRNARIAIVGEAWGEQERITGLPFQGASGMELNRMLKEAGINRHECFCTNVLNIQPINNQVETLCVGKKELPGDYSLPPISNGKYLRPEYLSHVARLREELLTVRPNIVIALGNTACWAILGSARISAIRGTIASATLIPDLKVLPTFHPAFVLRMWQNRATVVQDLLKAERESHFPEFRRISRTVLINPTLDEIAQYITQPHPILSVDIETTRGQIATIGFASTTNYAIVVPFITDTNPPKSHWSTFNDELQALNLCRALLETPIPKLFQNGLYDLQYLYRAGIRPKNCIHDTMLFHHSLYPEVRKGLGFLGSIYTDEVNWKSFGGHSTDSTKREE